MLGVQESVTALGVPVPESDSVALLLEALLAIASVPDTAPLAFGEKTTPKDAL